MLLFEMYMQAADAEKSVKAARRMVSFLDTTDIEKLGGEDSSTLAELYNTCARVCLEGELSWKGDTCFSQDLH